MRDYAVAARFVLPALACALLALAVPGAAAPGAARGPAPSAFCDAVIEIPPAECQALVTLYHATSHPGWTDSAGWLATETPCSWHGVTCAAGRVTRLELSFNQLAGSVPPELADLAALIELDLQRNQLTGPIPPALGSLASLEELYLNTNPWTGGVPPELGHLPRLLGLTLYDSPLSGPLPATLTNLTLDVMLFQFTGLCEPGNATFQAWLAGIKTVGRTGVICHAPVTVGVAPETGNSAPGALLTFAASYRDVGGWDDIRYADFLLHATDAVTDSVYLRYDVQAGRMWLRRPDDGRWMGGGQPGVAGTVTSNYATLDYGRSAVLTDTDALTVTWAFTPTYRTSGERHNLYLRAEDLDPVDTGWMDHGEWVINRMPTYLIPPDLIDATVPAAERMTFNPRYRDLDGWDNLRTLYFAIADTMPGGELGPGAIYLKYEQGENRLYLADSGGVGWGAGQTPGVVDYLSNDAVTVVVRWSTPGAADVRTRIVRWRLEFAPEFAGFHRVYTRAVDALGADTGWKYKGTLTVGP